MLFIILAPVLSLLFTVGSSTAPVSAAITPSDSGLSAQTIPNSDDATITTQFKNATMSGSDPVKVQTQIKNKASILPKVDMKFVVDTSGSMSNQGSKLAEGIGDFYSQLSSKGAQDIWTSVNNMAPNGSSGYYYGENLSQQSTTQVKSTLSNYNFTNGWGGFGGEQGQPKILDRLQNTDWRADAQHLMVVVLDTFISNDWGTYNDASNSLLDELGKAAIANKVHVVLFYNTNSGSFDARAKYAKDYLLEHYKDNFSESLMTGNYTASDVASSLTKAIIPDQKKDFNHSYTATAKATTDSVAVSGGDNTINLNQDDTNGGTFDFTLTPKNVADGHKTTVNIDYYVDGKKIDGASQTITYASPAKASVTYVDKDGNKISNGEFDGVVGGDTSTFTPNIPTGYQVVSNGKNPTFDGTPTTGGNTFDTVSDEKTPSQNITVTVEPITHSSELTTTATVNYTGAGSSTPTTNTQTIHWTAVYNEVTKTTTYTPSGKYNDVDVKDIDGYDVSTHNVTFNEAKVTTTKPADQTQTVTYTAKAGKVVFNFIDKDNKDKNVGTVDLDVKTGDHGTLDSSKVPTGYEVVNTKDLDFNVPDGSKSQTITVDVRHKHEIVKDAATTKYTVNFIGITENPNVQEVKWTKDTDLATNTTTYTADKESLNKVTVPVKTGYTPDTTDKEISFDFNKEVTTVPSDVTKTVTYTTNKGTVTYKFKDTTDPNRDPGSKTYEVKTGDIITLKTADIPTGYKLKDPNADNSYQVTDGSKKITKEVELVHDYKTGSMSTKYTVTYSGASQADHVQTVTWSTSQDLVTGVTTYTPSTTTLNDVPTPSVTGYTPDVANVTFDKLAETTTKPSDVTKTVNYLSYKKSTIDTKYTVNYTGASVFVPSNVQTITWTVTTDPITGEVKNYVANSTTLNDVTTPTLLGYTPDKLIVTASDLGTIPSGDQTALPTGNTVTVNYGLTTTTSKVENITLKRHISFVDGNGNGNGNGNEVSGFDQVVNVTKTTMIVNGVAQQPTYTKANFPSQRVTVPSGYKLNPGQSNNVAELTGSFTDSSTIPSVKIFVQKNPKPTFNFNFGGGAGSGGFVMLP